MRRFFKKMRILPPFPQGPQTLVARQLQCVCCQEVFTIAEDQPRLHYRGSAWQSPHDQHPRTALHFETNRAQVGILPGVRSQPIQSAPPDEESAQNYHINCPRCGADNRNWLFISENMEPLKENNVIRGGIFTFVLFVISVMYLAVPFFTKETTAGTLFSDFTLAFVCLLLAGLLPLIIVPGQWYRVRNYQLTRRFLPTLSEPEASPVLLTVILLYIAFILAIPGIKFGLIPITCYAVPICDQAEDAAAQDKLEEELKLWGKLLYSGTLVSLVSSIFAVLAVNEIVTTVNRHLPNPIYANTANMVRITLWETKRALEINQHFQEIQWTLTQRNDLGGVDMTGCFRDPPEILPNGRLAEQVRMQVYSISTDRWCVIVNTHITDTTGPRPAGGLYYAVPIPRSEPLVLMSTGREKY